jgi:16S rRNA processing protein RimM
MDLEGIIQIGAVVTSHGVKGEMKVLPLTDDPDIFHELDQLILVQKSGERKSCTLVGARETKKFWLLKFAEIKDMTTALLFKGAAIYTEEDNIRPLDEDEFYIHDLMDTKVYSTEGKYLGVITNYFEAGSQVVCEVQAEEDSFLFPTSQEILVEVIPSEKVVINLVPELRDLNKPKSK